MHIAIVNYYYSPTLKTPEYLLESYATLVGWARGVAAAGVRVSVVQRFGEAARLNDGNIVFLFVQDRTLRPMLLLDHACEVNRAIAALKPDVVHINGLNFAGQGSRITKWLPRTPLLVQDHAGLPPARPLYHLALRNALRQVDGLSFVSREQAAPWIEAGLIDPGMPIFELMEGSSSFQLRARAEARASTGLTGAPLCLWVGRLDSNKDPLTILRGFELALGRLPQARLAMVYGEERLLPAVRAWLREHPSTAEKVTLLGRQPYAAMEQIYNSADLFLLGSHHEGSGYALLEALSCGVTPVVTDIPSFRVLTYNGFLGGLWPPGDSYALARALLEWWRLRDPGTPERVRAFFERHFSFEAIGREAAAVYRTALERKAHAVNSHRSSVISHQLPVASGLPVMGIGTPIVKSETSGSKVL